MKTKLVILLAAMLATACVEEASPEDVVVTRTESQLTWMEERADDYLDDRQFRRDQLEAALWRPELAYARKRLSGYARAEGGWDLLPELDASAQAVSAEGSDQMELEPIGDDVPQTREEWLALGEEVFWRMPMRAAPYLQWLASRPDLWDEVGVQTRPDGTVRGLSRFRTARGEEAVGATCGLCHGDDGVAGRASRGLDLGRARALFTEERGGDGAAFDSWPRGSIDVTDDGVTDPVAMPNLWSVEHNQYLNASGVIQMTTPAALAVRLETQYIVGHSLETRPNRVHVWALTMYVLSLEHGDGERAEDSSVEQLRGRDVFDRTCASCHVPDNAFSGGLVPAATINSDPQAANSAYRGTGSYKIPSLVGISDGGPYLHDNSVPDLETLVGTHPNELELDDFEQDSLLEYLRTL